jgi:hypothetical protein
MNLMLFKTTTKLFYTYSIYLIVAFIIEYKKYLLINIELTLFLFFYFNFDIILNIDKIVIFFNKNKI